MVFGEVMSSILVIFLVALVLSLGFWLWYRRQPKIPLKSYTPPPMQEARHIEFEGEKVYFIQTGKGPDLVLIHGIGASIFTWRFLIQHLAKSYRVTALDLPGFGKSSKFANADYGLDAQRKRMHRFLEAIDVKKAFLVGSSMGGAIALWMAHEEPKRYPRVAVLAPATSPELIPRRLSRAMTYAPLTHKTLNAWTMRMILKQIVTKQDLINTESIEAYLEPFLDQGLSVKTFLAALQLLGDRRMPQCFEGIQSQVLIMTGDNDRMVTMKSIHRLIKFIPKAELVVSRSAGHHIMEDEPEWTLTHLLRFFSEN
jgi:pimeloyl-ACP methyl ester carboxylesterase